MGIIEIICIAIGAIATVLTGVWFIITYAMNKGRENAQREHQLKELKQNHSNLECVKNENYPNSVKNDIKEISNSHKNLECVKDTSFVDAVKKSVQISKSNNEMLQIVCAWVMKQDTNTIDEFSKKFSPRRMSSLGERVYEESKGKEVLENNIEFFIEQLRKIKPSTPYDVEQKALEVILPNLHLDMFIPIKTYLYNAPDSVTHTDPDTGEEKQTNINMQGVVFLMSLNLRDEYLKRFANEMKN